MIAAVEGPVATAMRERLEAAFSPVLLTITDDSDRHRGHAGHSGHGESHFTVALVSDAFKNQSRPACHRMVYDALGPLLQGPVHALSLRLSAPEETKT